jgi:hypothetical protein
MYRRIGLFAMVLATAMVLNAGRAKAQGAPPSVAPGGADEGALFGGKPIPATIRPAVANSQTAVSCNVCFTCGGDWPTFAGATPTASAASERGGSCSGGFSTAFNDHDPFICCR